MARVYVCDHCGVQFTVRPGFTARYGNSQDLCPSCGESYQRWAYRDRRTLEQKWADRERTERLDRAYK